MCLPKRNGGLYPAAHFCVYEICITTNNVVRIQYLPKKYHVQILPTLINSPITYIRKREVARRFCEVLPVPNRAKKKSLISFLSTGRVAPIFVYMEYVFLPTKLCRYNMQPKTKNNLQPHQQRCVNKI